MRTLSRLFKLRVTLAAALCLFAVCAVLWPAMALAASTQAASTINAFTARFRSLDSSQGLSQDSVKAMAQDRHGFIWLGTQDGLNRFDGYQVKTYRSTGLDDGSLASNWINAVLVDKGGVLWVATNDGLHRYLENEDRFQRFAPEENKPTSLSGRVVYALHLDARGQMWVGSDGGVSLWQPENNDFLNWQQDNAPALPSNQVRALASTSGGDIWLGTIAGLARLDAHSRSILPAPDATPASSGSINALLMDNKARLWVATDQSGVLRYTASTGEWLTLAPGAAIALSNQRASSLLQSNDGDIWIGTEAGLDHVTELPDGQLQTELIRHRAGQSYGLGRGRIASLLQDRTGSIWCGSWETGVAMISPDYSRFLSFSPDTPGTESLPGPAVASILVEGRRLWLGTVAGVSTFDLELQRSSVVPGTEALSITAMVFGGEHLWIGTSAGLFLLNRTTGKLSRPDLPPALRDVRIRRLLLDGDRLWLLTHLQGLQVFAVGQWNKPLAQHDFAANLYNVDILDKKTILVSAADGLYVFSRDGLTRSKHVVIDPQGGDSVLPAPPTGFARDSQGRVWLATYGRGLVQLHHHKGGALSFSPATQGLGLANEGINGVRVDDQDRLWLASDRGISRYDPQTKAIENFDALDGAIARGYYFSTSVQLANGWLGFGSKDGFTLFDPDFISPKRPLDKPLLLELDHDNAAVPVRAADANSPLPGPLYLQSTLALAGGWGKRLALHFASPEFVMPQRLRYSYQLEGFDDDWVYTASDRRSASYTNLWPGDYQFRVRSHDAQGHVSDETQLKINIAPLWWQSPWTLFAGAMVVVVLFWRAYRWRMNQMAAKQLALHTMVQEQTTALHASRRRAEDAVRDLRSAQDTRIRGEQLAATDRLLTGITRGLGMPVASSLAALNQLLQRLADLRQLPDHSSAESAQLVLADSDARRLAGYLNRSSDLLAEFEQMVPTENDVDEVFELAPFLDSLLPDLERLGAGRSVKMQLECASGLVLEGPQAALRNVMRALCKHAVAQFTGTGARMWIVARCSPDGRIELRIADNGRGLSSEQQAHLFEPFYALNENDHAGLGLFLAYHLVSHTFAGQITITGAPDIGNEFTIVLPAKK